MPLAVPQLHLNNVYTFYVLNRKTNAANVQTQKVHASICHINLRHLKLGQHQLLTKL